jgi:hypothetical protein
MTILGAAGKMKDRSAKEPHWKMETKQKEKELTSAKSF